MVRETHHYAWQCLQSQGSDQCWETTEQEIRAYLGFFILMGIVKEPEIRDYRSWYVSLHYTPIAGKISCKRFEEISRHLHFVYGTCIYTYMRVMH